MTDHHELELDERDWPARDDLGELARELAYADDADRDVDLDDDYEEER